MRLIAFIINEVKKTRHYFVAAHKEVYKAGFSILVSAMRTELVMPMRDIIPAHLDENRALNRFRKIVRGFVHECGKFDKTGERAGVIVGNHEMRGSETIKQRRVSVSFYFSAVEILIEIRSKRC